jgi:large subunit ribosomal protein L6
MSLRIAKKPIKIPEKVQVTYNSGVLTVKSQNQSLSLDVDPVVGLGVVDNVINITADLHGKKAVKSLVGTTCANIRNMMHGVTHGFEKKLLLVGVGYRAALKGKALSLSLGYSHPVDYNPPAGITIEVPSQTEIIIKGVNKQVVGQVAAEIRGFRPPEPYKGKGVKYSNEVIIIKETKKK